MAEWARVWKSAAKRWWRQARASWAVEALWIQERQALRWHIAKLEEITTTGTCCAYCGAAYPEGTSRFVCGDALAEHTRVCSEHPMRQAEERIKELEGIVEVFEDKDFFDALAKTVIEQLRRERDECRARMVRGHKLLVQDLEAVFPLAGEDVERAKQAMLDAVKDYVEGL